jgi:hypothetical protein
MEPKMNFYYPLDQEVDDPIEGSEDAGIPVSGPTSSFPKPKTRKEYFLACFFNKLNDISPDNFGELLSPKQLNDKDKTDDLQYACLIRKFVSPNPFEFSDNAYTLSINLLGASHGINFGQKHSDIILGAYYEVIIDNTYSCKVFMGLNEDAVPCGPYTVKRKKMGSVLAIISETEPTHIPVVDVYIHYIIYKQPKSTLEYYIAKAADYPLLNTDNPPEPKTTEEIYWAYICMEKESSGHSGELDPNQPADPLPDGPEDPGQNY